MNIYYGSITAFIRAVTGVTLMHTIADGESTPTRIVLYVIGIVFGPLVLAIFIYVLFSNKYDK